MENIETVKTNKYLLKITIPIFIELLLNCLIGNVDQFMISNQSQTAFSAIGNANQIINMLIIVFNVINLATIIMISQYRGAENYDKIQQIYSLSLVVNITFGVLVSAIIIFFKEPLLNWLQCPESLMHDSMIYLTYVGGSLFLTSLYLTFASFFKSNGMMKHSMYFSILMNVINIVSNFFLLYGFFGLPKLGIWGVCISTVLSKIIGLIIIIISARKNLNARISFRNLFPFPRKLFTKMMEIGLPSAGENFAYSISIIVIQKAINSFGSLVVAARVTVNLISFISWIFAFAIAQTTQIVVGFLMGAGDIEGTARRFRVSRNISVLLSFFGSLLLFIFSETICGLFVKDPEIIKICRQILFIDIFVEIGRALNLCTVRALQACGDTKFPIVLGIIDEWVVAVGGAFLLGVVFNLGIVGVWIALASDELIRGIIFTIRWNRGKWRNMSIVEKNDTLTA